MSITTKTVSGLDDSTAYYFNVLVKDSSGNNSAYTMLEQDTLDNTPPVPGGLGNLTVSGVSSSSVSVSWFPASDSVTGQSSLQYLLYYSVSSSIDTVADIKENGTPVDSYTSDITTKLVEGLSSSTHYYFNVLVKDVAGNESAYNKTSQITSDITAPVVGGSGAITAEDVQATSISISWSRATDDITSQANIQYLVYYSVLSSLDTVNQIEANGVPVGTYESDITSRNILGLTSSTSYHFNVIAKDEAGNKSAYTKLSQATDDITVPVVGLGGQLSLVSAMTTTATITWTEATDDRSPQNMLRYLMYYSLLPNIDSVANMELNGTPVGAYATAIYFKEVTGLTPSTNYYFNVIVQDEQGNKAAYNQKLVSLDITLPVPGNDGIIVIIPEYVKSNSILLQWEKATDDLTSQPQLQYLVYYSTNSAMDTLEDVKTNGIPFGMYEADITFKEVTGLMSGTNYYFNVVVKDDSGILLGGGNETVYGKQHYLTPSLDVSIASTIPDTGTTPLSSIPFTVTFIEGGYPVDETSFIEGDITVTNGAVDVGSLTEVVPHTSWTFDVVPTLAGAVTVQIEAGKVQDTNANNNTASNLWSFTYTTAIDITTLGRFVSGLPRDVTVSENTLQVLSLKVGTTTPATLTKAMAELLITTYTPGQGLPGANVSAGAKQDILETKLVALHTPVLAWTPTTGNTSDVVTTEVLLAAAVDIPVSDGEAISAATAWGIFVGTVSGASDIGKVLVRVSGTDNGVEDGNGDEVYGVLSESGGVYTLSYVTSAGTAYTILAENTTSKFDFYFVEVTDLYSFGVDRLLTPAIGGVIDKTLSGEVGIESAAREEADSSLQAMLNVEITARRNADNVEITARRNADSPLQANIDIEATAREVADSSLQANLNLEVTARLAADSSLQTELDTTQGTLGDFVDGTTGGVLGFSGTNYLDAEITITNALKVLDSQVYSESTTRVAADSSVQAALDVEVTARNVADSSLQAILGVARAIADSSIQAALDVEITARGVADSSVQAVLNVEITARGVADSSVQAALDVEVTARGVADSSVQAALDVEITARGVADSSVQAALDVEITARGVADSSVQAALNVEVTARGVADSSVQAALNVEVTARAVADSSVQATLDTETSNRMTGDSAVQAILDTETSNRIAGDSAVQAALTSETSNRMTADSAVQAILDTETSNRIAGDSAVQAVLDTETSNRKTGDSAVQAILDTETSNRIAGDSAVQAILDTETSNRMTGDSAVQAILDTETSNRITGDSAVQAALTSETSNRITGDSAVQAALTSETSNRITGDSAVQAALSIEVTARLNADSSLQAQIDNFDTSVVDASFVAATGGVSVGDVVIESKTVAGECLKANATVILTCENVLGVALETKTAGQTVLVRTFGNATVTTDGTNFDLGRRVFVATTAGQASKAVPTGEGNVVYLLGNATATNKVFVNPNLEYVIDITPLEGAPAGGELVAPAGGAVISPAT
jgi:preprotein translocase subunit SecB